MWPDTLRRALRWLAIHLTFIDPNAENQMFIYHFVSDSNATPTDPAGKFAEALAKLIAKLDEGNSHLFEGEAIREFRDLHVKGHFPGLAISTAFLPSILRIASRTSSGWISAIGRFPSDGARSASRRLRSLKE